MNKRTLALGLLFMIGAVVQVGAYHGIRWAPNRWCGHGPPYEGTLWTWATYGLPLPWLEIGDYERCTTGPHFPDIGIYPAGLTVNLATFGAINYLIRPRKREDKIIE